MHVRAFHQEHIYALIQTALRAAATAPTVFDALDVTGAALRAIQELSTRELTDDKSARNESILSTYARII